MLLLDVLFFFRLPPKIGLPGSQIQINLLQEFSKEVNHHCAKKSAAGGKYRFNTFCRNFFFCTHNSSNELNVKGTGNEIAKFRVDLFSPQHKLHIHQHSQKCDSDSFEIALIALILLNSFFYYSINGVCPIIDHGGPLPLHQTLLLDVTTCDSFSGNFTANRG